ncbi:hypothetical protein SBA4_3330021 [Candidatus Sulfopaludibacter sp. SbA4]|nr:hypothetical protein SBA4_3330021 [Candidatus Sulfopaludibacter sp. SbA4]
MSRDLLPYSRANYSWRSATTGSMRAARRAGRYAADVRSALDAAPGDSIYVPYRHGPTGTATVTGALVLCHRTRRRGQVRPSSSLAVASGRLTRSKMQPHRSGRSEDSPRARF